MTDNEELARLRREIDRIDQRLLLSIRDRMEVVKMISLYKKKYNLPVLDKKRWKEVLNSRITIGLSLGLKDSFVTDVYNLIHQESIRTEEKIKRKKVKLRSTHGKRSTPDLKYV